MTDIMWLSTDVILENLWTSSLDCSPIVYVTLQTINGEELIKKNVKLLSYEENIKKFAYWMPYRRWPTYDSWSACNLPSCQNGSCWRCGDMEIEHYSIFAFRVFVQSFGLPVGGSRVWDSSDVRNCAITVLSIRSLDSRANSGSHRDDNFGTRCRVPPFWIVTLTSSLKSFNACWESAAYGFSN